MVFVGLSVLLSDPTPVGWITPWTQQSRLLIFRPHACGVDDDKVTRIRWIVNFRPHACGVDKVCFRQGGV